MTAIAFLSVFIGAGFGACLRYVLGLGLNALFPPVPMGTLASNLLGAFLAGVIATFFYLRIGFPDAYRLFLITGFLGGLTTFSSFSLEMVALLNSGRLLLAVGAGCLHLGGSLALTLAGAWMARSLLS
jgi:fluoride exporter